MTTTPARRLPMLDLTHGNRSAVTCHLRCGDACAKPTPNRSETESFREIAAAALTRRTALGGAFALSVAAAATVPEAAAAATERGGLGFGAIGPATADVDLMRVPGGFRHDVILRWGDPLFPGTPNLSARGTTPAAQAKQFGYNCDYLDVIPDTGSVTRGVLVANHEYTNEHIMFPAGTAQSVMARTAIAAHGLSVVELRRAGAGRPWSYVVGGARNRRITGSTPFTVDGPAAGHALLRTSADSTGRRVLGTLNNCAGGTTPWGTVVSGEENFNQYFRCVGDEREARYGLGPEGDERNWRSVDPRFDATSAGYRNEPNRFGWIVQIDPDNPKSTPVKHTAMGRFKHEGANILIDEASGRAVAYMGDDERFDYLYKFVSRDSFDPAGTPAAKARNMKLLSAGDLFVARLTGDGAQDGVNDGTGVWIPLTRGGRSMVPGMSIAEVLVFTRLAADRVQATPMDRPEDVEPSPTTGRIYVACTNNSRRGLEGYPATDEANPRAANKDGHVVEITEVGRNHVGTRFRWNLFLICGDKDSAGTYFGGYTGPVSPISCPDNLAFDSRGNLWISTDGQPSSIGLDDALHCVETAGALRGRVRQFLSVPAGAETCGPVIHDQDGSVFVAVQHPGEDGTWEAPQSFFPDYGSGAFAGPRPSIVQVTRR